MSVTDSSTPGTDAYVGMLESLSRTPEQKKRARNLGIGYFVAAGIALAIFVRGDGGTSTFTLGGDSSIGLPGIPLAWLCAIVLAALGGVQISRGTAKLQSALLAAATILFIITLMAWAAAGRQFSLTGTLHDALKAATPLVLGAIAGILCERSGIINIAIEGLLLAGAFTSALVGSATNIWIGILAAMAVSAVLAWVLAWLAIRFHVDQVIVGFAINFFVLGLTSFLDSRVLTKNPQLNGTGTIAEWKVPGLSSIPVVGPILFEQTFYVYAALAHWWPSPRGCCSRRNGVCVRGRSASIRKPQARLASTSCGGATSTSRSQERSPASVDRGGPLTSGDSTKTSPMVAGSLRWPWCLSVGTIRSARSWLRWYLVSPMRWR